MNAFRLFLLSPGGIILLRWTALLLLAWAANGLLRWSHPRWRLILWRTVLVLSCMLPLALFYPTSAFQIPIDSVFAHVSNRSDMIALRAGQSSSSEILPPATKLPGAIEGQPNTTSGWVGRPRTASSGWNFFALVWILGGTAGAIRLLRLQLKLSRLRRNASEPNSELVALARKIQDRLSVRQPVAIRISNEVTSPFVCGLWHPTMILPAELLRTLEPAEIPALLSHETAHLRSHDLAWCVGWRWMKTLAWFHPLVWRIPAAHNLACEQEADRIASTQWADRSSYTQLLAQLALRVLALPSVETMLALNGGSQIAQRLTLLRRQGFHSWKWRNSVTGIGLVAGMTLVAMGWGFSKAGAEPNQVAVKSPMSATEMKHYENSEWHFAIDIPKSWNAFPPVSSNSPYEVVRFLSREDGVHDLIIFRNPIDPTKSPAEW